MQKLNDTQILTAAAEILERRAKYNKNRDVFSSPDAVRKFLVTYYASRFDGAEHFTVLYLDNRHRLLSAETPFSGTIDSAAVYPREIVKRALHNNAAAVILAHNHPSGVAEPSDTDIRLTRKLGDALGLLDIRVLDHIVIGDNTGCTTSMAERGLI